MSSGVQTAGSIFFSATDLDYGPWLEIFADRAPHRRILTSPSDDEKRDIRYAVVWKPAPGCLEGLPSLQAIFSIGAGVDHILGGETVPDVPIVRVVANDLTARMSEYVTWQVLQHHRQGLKYRELQKNSDWRELSHPAACDVTVGLMGLGVLGTDSARILKCLGFNLAGWSRSPKSIDGVQTFSGQEGLEGFLQCTDILVVLLPLTPQTRGCINEDLIGKLRRDGPLGSPILINVGRGGLQVENDILAALTNGRLGGVSLDVFEEEPLPAASALWNHPHAIITPHIAAVSDPANLIPDMLAQMEDFERGNPLKNTVNRQQAY